MQYFFGMAMADTLQQLVAKALDYVGLHSLFFTVGIHKLL